MQDVLNADWVGVLWDFGEKCFPVWVSEDEFIFSYPNRSQRNLESKTFRKKEQLSDLTHVSDIIIFDSAGDRLRWFLE